MDGTRLGFREAKMDEMGVCFAHVRSPRANTVRRKVRFPRLASTRFISDITTQRPNTITLHKSDAGSHNVR